MLLAMQYPEEKALEEEILKELIVSCGLEESDMDTWLPFCRAAWLELKNMLKPDVVPQGELICHVGVALAVYRYQLMNAATMGENFSTGDISVSANTSGLVAAKENWLDARKSIALLLKDDDFYFARVMG